MVTRLTSLPGLKHTAIPETVEDRIARLELRLEDGFARIGDAMNHGIEVDNWEQHWIQLLREYESLHEELEAAA